MDDEWPCTECGKQWCRGACAVPVTVRSAFDIGGMGINPHHSFGCDCGLPGCPSAFAKPKPDMVKHPKHYTWLKDKCGVEVWDITQWLPGNLANVVKYVLRADLKGAALEDLKKAQQYLQHEIDRLS